MDKSGKIFGKINIIDFSVILIVILALVGITIRFTSTAAEKVNEKVNFSYVVKVENIRMYGVDALEKMGTVTDAHGNVIGEIKNVEYEEFKTQVINADGRSVKVAIPERYVAKVTIESEGKDTDSGYFVGENTELSIGAGISLHTKYTNCSGGIIEINKIENQGE